MKSVLTSVLAAAALVFGAPSFAAAEHGRGTRDAVLELNAEQKWRTDESLRQGMENIRAVLAAQSHIFHGGDDSGTDYGALALHVAGELLLILQNSKVDALAEADLHKLVAQIVSGAQTMQGKEHGVSRRAGAERIAEALADYGRLFDHPGW